MSDYFILEIRVYNYFISQIRAYEMIWVWKGAHHRLLCLDWLDLQTFILLWGSMVILPLVWKCFKGALQFWRPALSIGSRFTGMGRGSGENISTLFLSDMGFRTMNGFYMFAQRARISVAFGAAWYLAYIGFLRNIVRMSDSQKTNFFSLIEMAG